MRNARFSTTFSVVTFCLSRLCRSTREHFHHMPRSIRVSLQEHQRAQTTMSSCSVSISTLLGVPVSQKRRQRGLCFSFHVNGAPTKEQSPSPHNTTCNYQHQASPSGTSFLSSCWALEMLNTTQPPVSLCTSSSMKLHPGPRIRPRLALPLCLIWPTGRNPPVSVSHQRLSRRHDCTTLIRTPPQLLLIGEDALLDT